MHRDAVKKPAANPANRHMTAIMMMLLSFSPDTHAAMRTGRAHALPHRGRMAGKPARDDARRGMVPHMAERKYVFDMGFVPPCRWDPPKLEAMFKRGGWTEAESGSARVRPDLLADHTHPRRTVRVLVAEEMTAEDAYHAVCMSSRLS